MHGRKLRLCVLVVLFDFEIREILDGSGALRPFDVLKDSLRRIWNDNPRHHLVSRLVELDSLASPAILISVATLVSVFAASLTPTTVATIATIAAIAAVAVMTVAMSFGFALI